MLETLYSAFSQRTSQVQQDVSSLLSSTTEKDDPVELLKIQFSLRQYSNYMSYQSSIFKTIGDLISGIIAKL